MKKIIYSLVVCVLSITAYPQGFAINTTNANPDTSAMLDVASTSKGFLMPRMTTTQRDAISLPALGLLVFNTTTKTFDYYTGSAWISLLSTTASTGTPKIRTFTISGVWIKPPNLIYITVEVLGGGGGGGGCYNYGGGAGASGGYAKKIIQADTMLNSVFVTVGPGGNGGSPQSPGENGGTSSFGYYCSATGGEGGKAQTSLVNTTDGSLPGIGINGDINFSGNGSGGAVSSSQTLNNGSGSIWGGAPKSLDNQSSSDGLSAFGYGSGGGGGNGYNIPNKSGGNGSSGIVIITEYY